MSKKTKAEKHARRVTAQRPRRRAHRANRHPDKHVNPVDLLLPLGSKKAVQDFMVTRGLLKVFDGLCDMGLIPPAFAAKVLRPGEGLVVPTDIQGKPK